MKSYRHVENVFDPKTGEIYINDTTYDIASTPPRKTGVMLVGSAGNNGSTFQASLIANKLKMEWDTKHGTKKANFLGSLSQSAVVPVGRKKGSDEIFYRSFKELVSTVEPTDIPVRGWDICNKPLLQAVKDAGVLDWDLQRKMASVPDFKGGYPLKSIYYPDFIAKNQEDRVDNALEGEKACMEHVGTIRNDIQTFKEEFGLDHVIVLWTANTERFMEVEKGVHDSPEGILKAIEDGHSEISPSLVFAVASVLEGCTFLNGSPQNTLVPGLVILAEMHGAFVGGNDFKSGQTKFKSVMADFLTVSGFKLKSVVSYNHLGNNDGLNLNSPKQFRSKEISKSDVINNIVGSNHILFPEGEEFDKPDHTVVIKYVPHVKDDKRALDEYISEIFMSGEQVLSTYNICPDSLLAVPIMLDLVVFSEWMTRLKVRTSESGLRSPLSTVLSHLSFFFKAPCPNLDEKGENKKDVANSLFLQRDNLAQLVLASKGLAVFNPLLSF
jgi:myo-inositol-1-phosphate synthase